MTSLRPFFIAALSLLALICFGIISLTNLEHFSFSDALWFTVVSLATVGFGDLVPHTTGGRIVTMLLILGGVSLLSYVMRIILVSVVEGYLSDIWGNRKMIKEISRLKDHIIVCGAGRVGKEVVAELIREKQEYVVIEKNPDILNKFHEEGSVVFIAGDATEDKVLLSARVEYARGVIVTLADDAENLLITVTCRDFNPKVRIVTRANRQESIIRLKRAGADTVICPAAIGGSRMALASLKPASVAFVQNLIDPNIDLNLEELLLKDTSVLVGKRLKDLNFRVEYGAVLLGIRHGEKIIINPSSAEQLKAGDMLIMCGAKASLSRLEKVVVGEKVS